MDIDIQTWNDFETEILATVPIWDYKGHHLSILLKRLEVYGAGTISRNMDDVDARAYYILNLILASNIAGLDTKSMNLIPVATDMGFRTIDEAFEGINARLHDLKFKPRDEQAWRYVWSAFWVVLFKSKISEKRLQQHCRDIFKNEHWLLYKPGAEDNFKTAEKSTTVDKDDTIDTIIKMNTAGLSWDEISLGIGRDKFECMELFIQYQDSRITKYCHTIETLINMRQ